MCETCSQYPAPISREEFATNCVQTPTCPECGRTVPAGTAWHAYDNRHPLPEPSPEVMRKLEELDA